MQSLNEKLRSRMYRHVYESLFERDHWDLQAGDAQDIAQRSVFMPLYYRLLGQTKRSLTEVLCSP